MNIVERLLKTVDIIPHFWNIFAQSDIKSRQAILRSLKAKANAKRTPAEEFADGITTWCGSISFFAINTLFFAAWILINTGLVPGVQKFDPFPFSLLTTIVSLEAIFLAIFVLISQNRAAHVDDLREELHLQINVIAEQEITKMIKLMAVLMEKNGIDISQDEELRTMLMEIKPEELERILQKEIS